MNRREKSVWSQMLVLACGVAIVYGCASKGATNEEANTLVLTNPLDVSREEVVTLTLSIDQQAKMAKMKPGMYQTADTWVEALDQDENGTVDQLAVRAQLAPKQTVSIDLNKDLISGTDLPKKTQAELSIGTGGTWNGRKYDDKTGFERVQQLRVPDAHTDHSYFIRYEGPGWENEQLGYRFYLDWRNAIDIFGKKVDTLVLQTVGQDGFDSYHEPSPWGMDILKAGKSLGVGSIGQYIGGAVEHFKQTDSVTCEITTDGYLGSQIDTRYYGWTTSASTTDLSSTLRIETGDRAVEHQIQLSKAVEGFCTGLVKHPKAEKMESLVGTNGWAYIATYGEQSLAGDNLGLAIIYHVKDVDYVKVSDYDHLVVFKPTTKKFSYYLLGAWEQEQNGIKTKEAFSTYLKEKIERLKEPVTVQLAF
ncbi:DUF4861 family protein [Reichenbachiella agariperforans]|nr:DUF4861 family protein [Reichenbachiella agariperforans]